MMIVYVLPIKNGSKNILDWVVSVVFKLNHGLKKFGYIKCMNVIDLDALNVLFLIIIS